ncbi:TPA: DUF551 domain-containing protein [Escherichia coli]|nr:DUF551 domain-containing protein [Escherichia coli]
MTTITKERLLTIKQWRETYGPGSNVVLPAEEAEELARIALASLEQNVLSGNPPVTPDGWIPVSERMPEPYEYVLVTDGFDGCEVMRVNTDGYWGPAKSLYPGSITHWMPLPEPPQGVNRG